MANLAETVWIPAFAGMTGGANRSGGATISPVEFSANLPLYAHKGSGIRRLLFSLVFGLDVVALWAAGVSGIGDVSPYRPRAAVR